MSQIMKTEIEKIKYNINLSRLLIINNSKFEIKIKRELSNESQFTAFKVDC